MENTRDINVNDAQRRAVKYCTTCGASLDSAAELCPKCGVRQAPIIPVSAVPANIQPQAPATRYCNTCGASLDSAAELCPKCGVRQTAQINALFGAPQSRNMNIVEAWSTCIKKIIVFNGRASQAEFAYFTFSLWAIGFVVGAFSQLARGFIVGDFFTTIHDILSILFFLPVLSVTVRRMHDFNTSGWFVLIIFAITLMIFIPLAFIFGVTSMAEEFLTGDSRRIITIFHIVIYGFVLVVCLVLALIKGTEGGNRFGN